MRRCDHRGCSHAGTLTVRVEGVTRWLCWSHARDQRAGGKRPTLEERGRRIASDPALRDHD